MAAGATAVPMLSHGQLRTVISGLARAENFVQIGGWELGFLVLLSAKKLNGVVIGRQAAVMA